MERTKIIPHEGKHTLVYARNNLIMTGTVHLLRDENGEDRVSVRDTVLPISAKASRRVSRLRKRRALTG